MQICKYCNKEYLEDEFSIALITNNKVYRRKKCNKCYAYTKKKNRHKKADWLQEYKKTLQCSKCNLSNYKVLEFHHPNDNKENNIGKSISMHSIDKVKKEISKCIVLCANCHREHHYDLWKNNRE